MGERKRIGIEDALRWAYRDELPKAQAVDGLIVGPAQFGQAWGGIERYGDLLTIVDAQSNRWGLVPDFTAQTEPHPDAIAIGHAVEALDEIPLDLPDDWHPLGDMADLEGAADLIAGTIGRAVAQTVTVDEAGVRRLKATPRYLVVRTALTGILPEWRADRPEVHVEMAHGKPRWFVRETLVGEDGPYEVELDGYNRSRQRPRPGAYQKRFLDPDPLDAAIARAEWEVWRSALDVLTDDLADRLEAYAVEPSNRSYRPWDGSGDLARRVLPDLSRPTASSMMLHRGLFVPVENLRRGA